MSGETAIQITAVAIPVRRSRSRTKRRFFIRHQKVRSTISRLNGGSQLGRVQRRPTTALLRLLFGLKEAMGLLSYTPTAITASRIAKRLQETSIRGPAASRCWIRVARLRTLSPSAPPVFTAPAALPNLPMEQALADPLSGGIAGSLVGPPPLAFSRGR